MFHSWRKSLSKSSRKRERNSWQILHTRPCNQSRSYASHIRTPSSQKDITGAMNNHVTEVPQIDSHEFQRFVLVQFFIYHCRQHSDSKEWQFKKILAKSEMANISVIGCHWVSLLLVLIAIVSKSLVRWKQLIWSHFCSKRIKLSLQPPRRGTTTDWVITYICGRKNLSSRFS